ncbi:hypothetical protein [Microbulbifer sp. JMSA003]|uniref:hypothetical protein n=1 Tax=Microbulbifer sp. JMSA003 TaxID=3243369 RepID=UPI004039249B
MHRTLFILVSNFLLSGCVGTATLISCAIDSPAEPRPTQKVGEFEFELNYSIDGESNLVSDTLVCSYRGRACDGRGLHNEWSRTFISGLDKVVLKRISEQQLIYYPLGGCQQLMDGNLPGNKKGAAIETKLATSTSWGPLAENELKEYGIQINKFRIKKKP